MNDHPLAREIARMLERLDAIMAILREREIGCRRG